MFKKEKLFEATKIEYMKELRRTIGAERASKYTVTYVEGWVIVRDDLRQVAKVRLAGFIQMFENVTRNEDFEHPAHRFKDSGCVVISIPGVDNSPIVMGVEPSSIFRQWKIEYRGKAYRLVAKDQELCLEKIAS